MILPLHVYDRLQVGACIVSKDNKIVGVGYNGFAVGVSDDDPDISWGKEGQDPVKVKYPYGECHHKSDLYISLACCYINEM